MGNKAGMVDWRIVDSMVVGAVGEGYRGWYVRFYTFSDPIDRSHRMIVIISISNSQIQASALLF